MTINSIFLSIIVGLNLVLGILVLRKNSKNVINRSFALMITFISGWMVANYLENLPVSLFWRELFLRIDFALAPLLAFFFFVFCFYISGRLLKDRSAFLLLILAGSLSILSFSGNIINNVSIKEGAIIFGTGMIFPIYALFAVVSLFYGCYVLVHGYRRAKGLKKDQLLYTLIGLSLTSFVVVLINLVLPQIVFVPLAISRIGIYSFIFLTFFSFYAVVKYSLMDIEVVFGKSAVYLASFGTAAALSLFLLSLNNKLVNPLSDNIVVPVVVVLSILLFQVVFQIFEKFAAKHFYYTYYSYKNILTNLSKKLVEILDIEKVNALITKTLIEVVKVDKIALVLRKQAAEGGFDIQELVGFERGKIEELVERTSPFSFMENKTQPLITEALSSFVSKNKGPKKESLLSLERSIKANKIALTLPLLQKEKVVGLLMLGGKMSGDPYTREDIDLLQSLAYQLSISINNALLYEQSKKDKEFLERFYKLTVGREMRMMELKERIKKLETPAS
jgi:hypothetical protein